MRFYGVSRLRSVGKTGNSGKRPLNKVHATIILLIRTIANWLTTVLISALIGQFNGTVRAMPISNWTVRAITCAELAIFFFTARKKKEIFSVLIKKRALYIANFVKVMINW